MESLTLHNRGWSLLGFKPKEHDYSQDYLTIVSLEDDNTISWLATSKTIYISTNNGSTWTSKKSYDTTSGVTLATLNEGDKLLIKGSNYKYSTITVSGVSGGSDDTSLTISDKSRFKSTKNFNILGNIMSLVYNSSFKGKTNLVDDSVVFGPLFDTCSHLISAKNLILPATTLNSYCYAAMFRNCTSLISAPELPATTLALGCYYSMFEGCTSLTKIELPNIDSIADRCFYKMFYGCSSLRYIKAPISTETEYLHTRSWVYRVANSGIFIKDPNITWKEGLDGYPIGWISRSEEEDLYPFGWNYTSHLELLSNNIPKFTKFVNPLNYPITFSSSDTNIATIDANGNITTVGTGTCTLSAVFLGDDDYPQAEFTCNIEVINYGNNYLVIVSLDGLNKISFKSVKDGSTSAVTYKSLNVSTDGGITFTSKRSSTGGTLLASLYRGDILLIKGSSAAYCTANYYNYLSSTMSFIVCGSLLPLVGSGTTTRAFRKFFVNCTHLKSAEDLSLVSSASTYLYQLLFAGCTSLTKAPLLTRRTLAKGLYKQMFSGCISLNYIRCLATDISATDCTTGWVKNVASTGTFIKNADMNDWTTGINGIPSDWTVDDY